jgi:FixJ family two-component response regulator
MMTKAAEIAHLSARERYIARAWAMGTPQARIARELGCCRRTVCYALARPRVRAHVERLIGAMDEQAQEAAAGWFYIRLLMDLLSHRPSS